MPMRMWHSAFLALLCFTLHAQRPHLAVSPEGTPERLQIFGTVTDSITGKPVYDCLVEYYDIDGQRLSISSVNSDGIYSMFIPGHMPFELRIEHENGYYEMRRSAPVIPEGVARFRFDLVLRPK